MSPAYVSYGLQLRVDAEIPGFAPGDPAASPDLHIWFHRKLEPARETSRAAWYQSPEVNRHGRPQLTIWRHESGAFHFVYDDGIEFLISQDARQVWCARPDAATLADAAIYLRGPILGMVLRMRGSVALHASCVAIGSSAIAIVGAGGAGKSTTAAGLVNAGHALVADDVCALLLEDREFLALPGPTRLSLWPPAGQAVFGTSAALPRLTPADGINRSWDKRYVDAAELGRYQTAPLPLAAIYVMASREETSGPQIEPMSPRDAFIALTEDTYVNYALDEHMRAREFSVLGQLTRVVPVRRITASRDPSQLSALCDAIVRDHHSAERGLRNHPPIP